MTVLHFERFLEGDLLQRRSPDRDLTRNDGVVDERERSEAVLERGTSGGEHPVNRDVLLVVCTCLSEMYWYDAVVVLND